MTGEAPGSVDGRVPGPGPAGDGSSTTRPPSRASARWGWVLLVVGLLLGVLTVALWFAGRSTGTATADPSATYGPLVPWSAAEPPEEYAQRLFAATNAARADEGLPPLAWSDCAAAEAAPRAGALVGAPDLEHAPLDGVMSACEVSVAAENLSRGAVPTHEVVDAWLRSPGHRANLLDPDLVSLGIACAREADEALTCAQVFLG